MKKAGSIEKISVFDFITSLQFFEDFTKEEKSVLIHKEGVFEKYTEGEIITQEGKVECWLYVILLGKVRLMKSIKANSGDNRISLKEPTDFVVKELEIGSIFGEISLITKRPRNVTAVAGSPDVALMKVTEDILKSFDESIQMKFQKRLLLKLAENLDDMNTKYVKQKAIIQSK